MSERSWKHASAASPIFTQGLSLNDVRAYFAQSVRPAAAASPGYRQAAAVLAAISDPMRLQPVDGTAEPGEALQTLRADLIEARGSGLPGVVMLAPEARRETLRQLGTPEAFSKALQANPGERKGSLQETFESYLLGGYKPIAQQSTAELDDSIQALRWIGDVVPGLPAIEEVRAELDRRRFIAPFEQIAGDDQFRGRRREMDRLRLYVGVQPPESLLRRLGQAAIGWTRPVIRPALSIYGPGGVGKSALVARFMLEHTRVPAEAKVPFAYLDLDRSTLDVGQPLTLCLEMLSQLRFQFPDGDPFGRLHAFLQERIERAKAFSEEQTVSSSLSVLADLHGIAERYLGARPYVVVLDTFEEVQYRGEQRAYPFWEVLGQLQERWPALRVVVSGRSPVTSLVLAGKEPDTLELGALDDDAAVAYLTAQGLGDPSFARRVVRQFGGVPLTLKLVASLIQRLPASEQLENVRGRSTSFWRSASDETIQGQLYERILGHIHNPQVARLAHPGLVVRRVTPELILEVLNEPCELGLADIGEAQRLFAELERETSLVAHGEDGALVHRPDLRRVMLKLLEQRSPAQVEAIHRAAVGYYQGRPEWRDSAESAYHRLQLGEVVAEQDLRDRNVRSSIQASLVELPPASQRLLASYGFDVPEAILASASLAEQDRHLAAQVEDLLPYGDSSVNRAHRLLARSLKKLDRPSPLWRAAARVAMQRDERDAAMRNLDQGLTLAYEAGHTREVLALLEEKAWLQIADSSALDATLQSLEALNRRHEFVATRVQVLASRVARQAPAATESEFAGLLPNLRPAHLWDLLPLLAPALRVVRNLVNPDLLLKVVLRYDSPFRQASFANERAERALAELQRVPPSLFIEQFAELAHVWPYRVLRVRPPFGNQGASEREELV